MSTPAPTTTSGSNFLAVRQHGVCRGSLWRQEDVSKRVNNNNNNNNINNNTSNTSSNNKKRNNNSRASHKKNAVASSSSSATTSTNAASASASASGGTSSSSSFFSGTDAEYCLVTTNMLICYESWAAYQRGNAPVRRYRVVGASAWARASSAATSAGQSSFRLVTDQGTHVYCQAMTPPCRDVWLSTLQAGLEWSLLGDATTNSSSTDWQPLLEPPTPQVTVKKKSAFASKPKFCASCGAADSTRPMYPSEVTPVAQYGLEYQATVCHACAVAQGLLDHVAFLNACCASAQQERSALLEAREFCRQLVQPASSMPPSRSSSSSLKEDNQAASPLESDSDGAAGTQTESDTKSDDSNESWTKVESSTSSGAAPLSSPSSSSWIHIAPSSAATQALLRALQTHRNVQGWVRVSPIFQTLRQDVLEGRHDVTEFLEQLDEAVGLGEQVQQFTALKKQAFRVAGDMGTAMKLLADHALPLEESPQHAQTLQCLLEFFLDLCQAGEISSVAFFWPQLCHIHLCMLPPSHAAAAARVDLMEDFLCTVATQYSVQLALHLVWSHTADLEDSLNPTTNVVCAPVCKHRRFAVLRFVCELESLLFGLDTGWGGGHVTLGKLLSATSDQLQVVQQHVQRYQAYRQQASHQLDHTKSVRQQQQARYLKIQQKRKQQQLQQLQQEKQSTTATSPLSPGTVVTEAVVQEKLRIANNADYFTSHLNFTRRVCDVAEKLRFLDRKLRADALQEELRLLNASGAMGGDPLNRIVSWQLQATAALPEEDGATTTTTMTDGATRVQPKNGGFVRVVRVPPNEGHVFRSKERTPVLLLLELVDESLEAATQSPVKPKTLNTKLKDEEEKEATEPTNDADEDDGDPSCRSVDPSTPTPTKTIAMTPTKPHPAPPVTMEGSEELPHRPGAGALRRFDGASTVIPSPASTPKRVVEEMVTSVMVEQLIQIDIHNSNSPNKPTDEDDSQPIALKPSPSRVKASRSESDRSTTVEPTEKLTRATSKGSESSIPDLVQPRKMLVNSASEVGENQLQTLAPTGDIRREVLNVIMMRGKKGNSIAAGTAESMQRSLKELERKRATALLLGKGDDEDDAAASSTQESETTYAEAASTSAKLASLGFAEARSGELGDMPVKPSEEDETMEAVRLLLVQNRVAQGHLSPEDAAKVLQHVALARMNSSEDYTQKSKGIQVPHPSDMPTVDAGDLDPRLAGCGPLPPAVLKALTLWKGEMVTNGELLELVKKDIAFVRQSVLLEDENKDKRKEDSAFWGRFAFGERWAEKKARIAATSPEGARAGWDLVGIIVKSNDDLRQEAFVMQLIELCQEAFEMAGLELWVNPYRILATGRQTGIIEMVRNAMSFDALKKRPGYGKGGLREHLQRMTEYSADPGSSFQAAQSNFVRSLAAYSLISYFFLIKDRHNGNLLLDTAGHVIHIDFGFVFGIAPGGSFSLEMSTPFKLTEEMLEVMGGLRSPLFSEFVTLFCCGFLALQSYSDTFCTLVDITSRNSTFKCFDGQNRDELLSKLRERFCPELDKEKTIAVALDLIQQATSSYGTRQYDMFQYLSQGIAA